jgi:hypothetical protein
MGGQEEREFDRTRPYSNGIPQSACGSGLFRLSEMHDANRRACDSSATVGRRAVVLMRRRDDVGGLMVRAAVFRAHDAGVSARLQAGLAK